MRRSRMRRFPARRNASCSRLRRIAQNLIIPSSCSHRSTFVPLQNATHDKGQRSTCGRGSTPFCNWFWRDHSRLNYQITGNWWTEHLWWMQQKRNKNSITAKEIEGGSWKCWGHQMVIKEWSVQIGRYIDAHRRQSFRWQPGNWHLFWAGNWRREAYGNVIQGGMIDSSTNQSISQSTSCVCPSDQLGIICHFIQSINFINWICKQTSDAWNPYSHCSWHFSPAV